MLVKQNSIFHAILFVMAALRIVQIWLVKWCTLVLASLLSSFKNYLGDKILLDALKLTKIS
jgi:hypothetical protein